MGVHPSPDPGLRSGARRHICIQARAPAKPGATRSICIFSSLPMLPECQCMHLQAEQVVPRHPTLPPYFATQGPALCWALGTWSKDLHHHTDTTPVQGSLDTAAASQRSHQQQGKSEGILSLAMRSIVRVC